jgi:hypothetical protein
MGDYQHGGSIRKATETVKLVLISTSPLGHNDVIEPNSSVEPPAVLYGDSPRLPYDPSAHFVADLLHEYGTSAERIS